MVEVLIIAGTFLAALIAITVYSAAEYRKRLQNAQKEYEKARDLVEAVVMSFNRELKNEAEQLQAIAYKLEQTTVKADNSLRELDTFQNRVQPLETKVDQLNSQVGTVTAAVSNLSEANLKTLEELSTLDFSAINIRVQEIGTSQETLKTEVAALSEKVQNLPVTSEPGTEPPATSSTPMPVPVLPIRRDKAMAALTETEVAVLEFLSAEGPKTAPEIKEKVSLSREHTARLMKKLYEEGYLERDTGKLPFRYSVKEEMARLLKKTEPTTT